jgi:hypothetical protein
MFISGASRKGWRDFQQGFAGECLPPVDKISSGATQLATTRSRATDLTMEHNLPYGFLLRVASANFLTRGFYADEQWRIKSVSIESRRSGALSLGR